MTSQIPDRISLALAAVAAGEAHNGEHDIPAATARVIALAALDAVWPQVREHFATLIEAQNPDRSAEFSDGVDWAADTIREEQP